jgi:hypothetical protein
MIEIRYWVAEDGTRFDDEYDCIQYERKKKLEEYKDDFVFYDEQLNIIFPEEANTEQVCIIVVKTHSVSEYIGEWFEYDGCENPFCGCEFGRQVGTWVYGDIINEGNEWIKLEDKIEKLQNLIEILNRE